jgi:hypothetical protein
MKLLAGGYPSFSRVHHFCSDCSFGELVSLNSYFVVRKVGVHGRNRIFPHIATHAIVV